MNKNRAPRNGFTLIEMLVTMLITGVLMAAIATVFRSATTDSHTKQCRADMQIIANAEEQYRLKSNPHAYTTTITNLSTTGAIVPKCPDGGTYTVTLSNGIATAQNGQIVPNGNIIVSCNASGHGKFAPGIDTN